MDGRVPPRPQAVDERSFDDLYEDDSTGGDTIGDAGGHHWPRRGSGARPVGDGGVGLGDGGVGLGDGGVGLGDGGVGLGDGGFGDGGFGDGGVSDVGLGAGGFGTGAGGFGTGGFGDGGVSDVGLGAAGFGAGGFGDGGFGDGGFGDGEEAGGRSFPGAGDERKARRAAGRGRARRGGRRWRYLLAGLLVAAMLAATFVYAEYAYVHRLFNRIPRIPIGAGVLDDSGGGPVTAFAGDDPKVRNILLVGVDSRANVPTDQCETFGCSQVQGRARSDTIMIVRISPKYKAVEVLSIPRDLYVQLPSGTWGKINAAYGDGAESLILTIKKNLRMPVNNLAEVDFVGFETMVNSVGGVEICFDRPTRDLVTGLLQPESGCHVLDQRQAIAYVRSRSYEQQRSNGDWARVPGGDLLRIKHQQLFIKAILQRAISKAGRNPIKINRMIESSSDAVKLDSTFNFNSVLDLANEFRSFDPAKLVTYTVPGIAAETDAGDVLKIDHAKARSIVGRFGGRT